MVAQVTDGRSFSMSKLRDFIYVVELEKTATGVYVTLRRNMSADSPAEAAHPGRTQAGGDAGRGGSCATERRGRGITQGEGGNHRWDTE